MDFTVITSGTEETQRLGRQLGELLRGGDLVCLFGELGSGKTAFAQGVGKALEVQEPLTSPTFTLIQEYAAKAGGEIIRLVHMDLYRLKHPEEAEIIGVTDQFQEDRICLIEWPEIALQMFPEDRVDIFIEGNGDLPRRIHVRSNSAEWLERLIQLSGGQK